MMLQEKELTAAKGKRKDALNDAEKEIIIKLCTVVWVM